METKNEIQNLISYFLFEIFNLEDKNLSFL